jgi:hypothetical protein
VKQADSYDVATVAEDLQIDTITTRRELKLLAKTGFVKDCTYTKQIVKSKKSGTEIQKKKVEGYKINPTFPYLSNFKGLLLDKEELAPNEIFEHFKKLGKVELFLLAGVFQGGRDEGEVDILIVGKNLKRSKIEEKIAEIEDFMGTELSYAIFDTEEFMYRYMMADRFVREILHKKHEMVVNTLNIKSK